MPKPKPMISITTMMLIAITLLACLTTPVYAGEYQVHTCTKETGNTNNSWKFVTNTNRLWTGGKCDTDNNPDITSGWGVEDIENTNAEPGDRGEIIFTAPTGTHIQTLWLDYGAKAVTAGWEAALRDGSGTMLMGCAVTPEQNCFLLDTAFFRYLDTDELSYELSCNAQQGTCKAGGKNPNAFIHLYSAIVTLEDLVYPTIDVGERRDYKFGETIHFSAADNVGIKEARFYLRPGDPVVRKFDCDYTKPIPCNNQDASFTLDFEELRHSARTIQIGVVDAAGNETKSPGIFIWPEPTKPDEPVTPPDLHPTPKPLPPPPPQSKDSDRTKSTGLKVLTKPILRKHRSRIVIKARCQVPKNNQFCAGTLKIYAQTNAKHKKHKRLLIATKKYKLKSGIHILQLKPTSKGKYALKHLHHKKLTVQT